MQKAAKCLPRVPSLVGQKDASALVDVCVGQSQVGHLMGCTNLQITNTVFIILGCTGQECDNGLTCYRESKSLPPVKKTPKKRYKISQTVY